MAMEVLAVPEEYLREVIWVIRAGINAAGGDGHRPMISQGTEEQLLKWCKEEEEYLDRA
jgi:hypothetical protein